MPAVTLAGALALAGCGGSDNKPASNNNNNNNNVIPPGPGNCASGTKWNAATSKCEVDTAAADAEKAKADAAALYGKIKTDSVAHNAGTDPDTFAKAKDEHKGSKAFYAKGKTFKAANGGTQPIASGSPNAGYYDLVTANSLAVTSSKFTRDSAGATFDASSGAFSGEYAGIPGMFLCVGTSTTTCTAKPAADGKFTLMSPGDANWLFKPNSETATMSKGEKLAEWGWWIENQGAKDEVVSLYYTTISSSDAPAKTSGVITVPAGTATYTGDALGQYAVVDGANSLSGEFEAKAKLTADFEKNELSGEIHDFNVGTGWKVMLEKDSTLNGAAGTVSGETKWMMGTDAGLTSGEWNADMYGGDGSAAPTHIIGGFSAAHSNARMIGAFGTEHQKPGN